MATKQPEDPQSTPYQYARVLLSWVLGFSPSLCMLAGHLPELRALDSPMRTWYQAQPCKAVCPCTRLGKDSGSRGVGLPQLRMCPAGPTCVRERSRMHRDGGLGVTHTF